MAAAAAVLLLAGACTSDPSPQPPAVGEDPASPPDDDEPDPTSRPDDDPDGGTDDEPDGGNGDDVPDDDPEAPSTPVELPEAPDRSGPVQLSEAEVYPNAKSLASAIAQAVTTYDRGQSALDAVAELDLSDGGQRLARQAADLHRDDTWSRGRIVYPQLGGVDGEEVSVMVVTEQTVGSADGVVTRTRTLDVRLRLAGQTWVFDELADDGGTPVDVPARVSAEAQRVLDHPDLELPDSARWDILAGEVDRALLDLLARAADEVPLGAVTLRSGHPELVFGTDRVSSHTRGRAIDIHRVKDREVIDDRSEDSRSLGLVEWLYDQPEVAQVGSPWALDEFGGRSFTDVVHQDHIHVAVYRDAFGRPGGGRRG